MIEDPDHVTPLRGHPKRPLDMTESQREFLRKLNGTLADMERLLVAEVNKQKEIGNARVADPDDWVRDYEIECCITYVLREDDAAFSDESDNILVAFQDICCKYHSQKDLLGDGENHNVLPFIKEEHHCWLYHCLYDHTDLGWADLLRIGHIHIDVKLVLQNWDITLSGKFS